MITTWTSWCGRHWCMTIVASMMIAMVVGLLPSPHDVLPELARRPDVVTAFQDPLFGKQDAMIFLFSFLFLGPFAGLIGFFLALFVLGALGGVFLPLGRRVGIPERVSTTVYVMMLFAFIYVERDVWMQPSLWFIGLVARSWMLVMS